MRLPLISSLVAAALAWPLAPAAAEERPTTPYFELGPLVVHGNEADALMLGLGAFDPFDNGSAAGATLEYRLGRKLFVIGPAIGGIITDTIGWHWIFFVNLPLGAVVLAVIWRTLPVHTEDVSDRSLDYAGAALLTGSLVPILVGLTNKAAGDWTDPMVGGLILLGLVILPIFLWVESRAHEPLVPLQLFRIPAFSGSVTAMFLAAMAGPKLAAGFAPRRVARWGLLALAAASIVLLATIDVELDEPDFVVAVSLFGIGAGLLISQLGNVIMSSVDPAKTNEAGGLQGTAQNLGASLGTALIGSVLIAALTTGFVERVQQNPALPGPVKQQVAALAQKGVPVVPVDDVQKAAEEQGLPAEQAQAVAADYGDAQLQGLKRAIGAVAIFALLSLWFTRRLPGRAR